MLTTLLTVISGALVFILGQLFIEYILKPLQRYRSLRAKAAYCLIYYGNRYDLTTDIARDTAVELRKMAAELASFAIEKPVVVLSIKRGFLEDASACFIGLSNSVSETPNYEYIRESVKIIKHILDLH